MDKLKPMYLYRLRLISAAPRFYGHSAQNAYLEKRGLIRRTGRTEEGDRRAEFVITEAGRAALAVGSEE